MWNAIKKQFRVQTSSWLVGCAITLGTALIGMVLMAVLMRTDEQVTTYFSMGTLMGGLSFVIFSFFTVIGQMQLFFNLEVSMGCTRKHFFVSTAALDILMNAAGVLLVVLVGLAENVVYGKFLYPALENEINVVPYLLKAVLPAAILLTAAGMVCSVLTLRFGRKAFGVLWGIWMFGCLVAPRIYDASVDTPDSLFGRIGIGVGRIVRAVPADMWLLLGVAFCVGCLAVSYLLIRKQEVTGAA